MSIQSINHVQLAFPAGAEAQIRHFYGTLLSLPELGPQAGRKLRFSAGGQRIELVPATNWRAASSASLLAFEVQDLPALRDRLLEADLPLVESPAPEGALRIYVKDPAGNQLEFLEPLAAIAEDLVQE